MNNKIERKTRRYNEYYFKDKKGFELMKVDKRYLVRDVLRLQQESKELHNKIDKAIQYMEHYIKVEERKYNDNVMKEFEYVIKLLKNNC
jgi:hypothetical protein